jgi:hypothetical protein
MSGLRTRSWLIFGIVAVVAVVLASAVPVSAKTATVLQLSQAVDDTAWITSIGGVVYSTDGVDNEVFAITGNFPVGTVITSVTPGDANVPVNAPNYLGYLNLRTGQISPAVTTNQSKGLLYVP